jgi:hypothetical protein
MTADSKLEIQIDLWRGISMALEIVRACSFVYAFYLPSLSRNCIPWKSLVKVPIYTEVFEPLTVSRVNPAKDPMSGRKTRVKHVTYHSRNLHKSLLRAFDG